MTKIVKRTVNGVVVEFTINGIAQPLVAVRRRRPSLAPPPQQHKKKWPVALAPLKLLAQEGDCGAGDIIARVIGPIGGNAFKKWYKTIFGKGCGCGARQETLNARWPLPAS